MSLETWVSIGSLLIATLTLAVVMRSMVTSVEARVGVRIDDLGTQIDRVETNLSTRIEATEVTR